LLAVCVWIAPASAPASAPGANLPADGTLPIRLVSISSSLARAEQLRLQAEVMQAHDQDGQADHPRQQLQVGARGACLEQL